MTVVDLETDRRYAGLVTVVPKLGVRWAPTPGSSPSCWQPAWRSAPRDAEVAELTQALTARVWAERAKGH